MMLRALRQCEYIYWRNRGWIGLTVVFAVTAGSAVWMAGDRWPVQVRGVLALAGVALPAFLSLSVLSFSQDLDLTRPESAFPRGWCALPARTWQLAAVPVVVLLLLLMICWAVALWTLGPLVGDQFPWQLILWMALGTGSWLQWLAWKPVRHPLTRLAGLLVIPLWLSALILVQHATAGGWWLGLVGLGYWVTGAIASVAAVGQMRAGSVGSTVGRWSFAVRESPLDRKLTAFPSPSVALRWRDNRQVTFLLPWLSGVFTVLALLLGTGRAPHAGFLLIWQVPMFLGLCFGSSYGKSSIFGERSSRLPIHLAVLPVTTWEMAKSRFSAILIATSQAWLVTVPALAILLVLNRAELLEVGLAQLARIDPLHPPWKFVAAALSVNLLLTAVMATAAAWVTAAGRPWLEVLVTLTGAGVVLFVMVFALLKFVTFASLEEAWGYFEPWRAHVPAWLWGALTAKVALMVGATVNLACRGLVPNRAIAGLWASWLIATLALTSWFGMLLPALLAGGFAERWAVLALLIPGGSLGLFVVMLDWNRHR